jgi:hypothetical protein
MIQSYTATENAILDDIIKSASFYDLEGVEENSDREITIHYAMLGQGSWIADRIIGMMLEKHPEQEIRVTMPSSERKVLITLLESEDA